MFENHQSTSDQIDSYKTSNQVQKAAKKPERESNFELLRLVSIFFIVLHHFILHGLNSINYLGDSISFSDVVLNSFVVIGVNSFRLISGYFGIKASWKGFFRLYIMCVSYNLLIGGLSFIQDGFHIKQFIFFFFPFSHSDYWFITCYFFLFLISPLLNKMVDNCTKREFIIFLLICSILTFYFGWFWRGGIDKKEYNVWTFVFLYFIGRFIALHTRNSTTAKRKIISLLIYITISLLIALIVITLFSNGEKIWIWRFGNDFNSPLIIISSVAIFSLFRSIKIKSKVINWAAVSVLAVYLIHESPHISRYLYQYVYSLGNQIDNKFILGLLLFLLAIGLFVGCILIDKVRIFITKPIETRLIRINWDGYVKKSIEKLMSVIK